MIIMDIWRELKQMTNRFCNVRFFATIGIAVKEAIEMLNPK